MDTDRIVISEPPLLHRSRVMNEMLDVAKYREKYPDLQKAFGDDWDAYVAHYLTHGAFEHRDSGTGFDPVDYLERYGDLKDRNRRCYTGC